jgi:YesN/AraC family two-component response regulator
MNDLTLLYVDDEETNLQLFDLTFSTHFNIVTASSAEEALEIVKNQKIKIVISDYKMPRMNGMELIQEIKKLKPETICMIMSGYVESEVITDKSLLYRFIMKPWKRQELTDTIKEIYH